MRHRKKQMVLSRVARKPTTTRERKQMEAERLQHHDLRTHRLVSMLPLQKFVLLVLKEHVVIQFIMPMQHTLTKEVQLLFRHQLFKRLMSW